jgi:predicted DNA-binding transcriptional regulator AlpA
MPMNVNNQTPQFTNLSEVAKQTSLGKSTILAWESQGKFPKAVRLSATKRVWLQSDIANWMLRKCELS